MKIAIDVRSLMEGRLSGVESYTINVIQALLRVAPEHEYHLFYNSWRSVQLPTFTGKYQVESFRFPNKLFNLSQYVSGRPRWDTLLPAVDCVFMPNMRLMPLSYDLPLVVTAHDLSFEWFPELYSWRRRMWHRLMKPQRLMQRANAIIAVSAATKRDLLDRYRVVSERVRVVHSGVVNNSHQADQHFFPVSPEIENLFEALSQKPYILYLGTIEPRKNVVSIVEAFSAIAQRIPHDLVLAGSRGWLVKEVDQAIARSAFRDRIHRLGFVSDAQKQILYQQATVFVYPSFYEGFGFPPLEALLAGTPVITSHNSALPEVVGQWATLIDPYNVSELAAVLEDILLDPPRVPEQVQETIRQRYSWDRAARETIEVLESAAAGRFVSA